MALLRLVQVPLERRSVAVGLALVLAGFASTSGAPSAQAARTQLAVTCSWDPVNEQNLAKASGVPRDATGVAFIFWVTQPDWLNGMNYYYSYYTDTTKPWQWLENGSMYIVKAVVQGGTKAGLSGTAVCA